MPNRLKSNGAKWMQLAEPGWNGVFMDSDGGFEFSDDQRAGGCPQKGGARAGYGLGRIVAGGRGWRGLAVRETLRDATESRVASKWFSRATFIVALKRGRWLWSGVHFLGKPPDLRRRASLKKKKTHVNDYF